jgi:hypothetical protein
MLVGEDWPNAVRVFKARSGMKMDRIIAVV